MQGATQAVAVTAAAAEAGTQGFARGGRGRERE